MEHATENARLTGRPSGRRFSTRAEADAAPLHPVLQMQRQLGNQAVLAMLRSGALQAKLSVGAVDDPLEHEADRVADQVMRMPERISRKCSACAEEDKDDTLRRKAAGPAGGEEAPQAVHDVLGSSGEPLDAETRGFFEPRFGRDFSAVRIHTGRQAAESARAISAQAYAVGGHIAFADGRYVPGTDSGRRLLAHELAHVIQQSRPSAEAGLSAATGQVQRAYVEDDAAGCGICESPQSSGSRAHEIIQESFLGSRVLIGQTLRGLMAEVGVAYPESPVDGIVDLARITSSPSPPFETIVEIGEIKPYNARGIKDGVRQLAEYKFELEHSQVIAGVGRSQLLVGFLELPPPPSVLAFLDPTSKCGEQGLSVDGPDGGLYLYSCAPPRSSYPKEQCCEGKKVPVPVPLPVGAPEKQKEDSTGPSLAPVPVPVGPVAVRSTADRILDFIRQLLTSGAGVEEAVTTFLKENPDILRNVEVVVAGIAAASIVSDILSGGAAIAKDPAVVAILTAMVRIGQALRVAVPALVAL